MAGKAKQDAEKDGAGIAVLSIADQPANNSWRIKNELCKYF